MNNFPLSKVYADAANLIKQQGWSQNAEVCKDGSVCVAYALYKSSSTADASLVLESYLGMRVATWNDTVCKNKEQAIASLLTMAAIATAKGE